MPATSPSEQAHNQQAAIGQISNSSRLAATRRVFEEKAKELLQGQLWRHLLTNAGDVFLTEFFADKFEEESLRIDQLQPIISDIQTTFAFDIEDDPTSKWRRREQAYLKALNADDLYQKGQELVRLANDISKPQIKVSESQSYSIAQLLLGYSENLHRNLELYEDYQRLVTQLAASDLTRALNFLYKAKHIETLLTDIMLLLKASYLIEEEDSKCWTLLKNYIRYQWLSNTALMILLSANNHSVLNLIAEPLVYGQAPSELLKCLTDEEWLLCLDESIGITDDSFFRALIKSPEAVLAVCSKQAIISYAREQGETFGISPASAVLTCPQLMPSLDNDTLVDLFTSVDDEQVKIILASPKRKDLFVEAILKIVTSPSMREAYDKQSSSKSTLNIEAWLLDEYVLAKLDIRNFIYCTSLFNHLSLKKLLENSTFEAQAFRTRLEQLTSDELIDLTQAMNHFDPFASAQLLLNSKIAAKLTKDKKLPNFIQLIDRFHFDRICEKSPELRAYLQGDTLLESLVVVSQSMYYSIIYDNDLIARVDKDAIYNFIVNHEPKLEASQVDRLLGIKDIAKELSNEQLLALQAIYAEQSKEINSELRSRNSELSSRNTSNDGFQASDELVNSSITFVRGQMELGNVNANLAEQKKKATETVENESSSSESLATMNKTDNTLLAQPSAADVIEPAAATKSTALDTLKPTLQPPPVENDKPQDANSLLIKENKQPSSISTGPVSKQISTNGSVGKAIWDQRSLFYCLLGGGLAAALFFTGLALPSFILGGALAAAIVFETAVAVYKLISYCLASTPQPQLAHNPSPLFPSYANNPELTGYREAVADIEHHPSSHSNPNLKQTQACC